MALPNLACLAPTLSLAFLASTLMCGPVSAQTPSARNVLTIHSGAVDYPTNPVLDAAIREPLLGRPGPPLDYFSEYLEFDRFPESETSLALSDYIYRKYQGRRIDLVIAVTSRALQFVLANRERLFPAAAIVFAAAIATEDALVNSGLAVTGVRVRNNYTESLKLALELHPATKKVFVIATSPNSESVESVRGALRSFSSRVELTYIDADTLPRLQAAVAAVPRGSLILYVWHLGVGPEYVLDPREPARLVAEAARVPVYGVSDWLIGTGIVGGVVRDTRATGTRAGEIARQVLEGTPPRTIPIEDAPLGPIFDWGQLRRWGIDSSRLPPGSDIRFRVPTVWEAYDRYIISALVVMAMQLVLIAGLLTQRVRRRRAEQALRAREATLQASHRRIRRLAGGLIKAQETVRAEIARDLHDDICQQLVGVSMTISTLKRSSGSVGDAPTQRVLAQLERAAHNTVESVRRLSHDLHPASLRLLGLTAALRGHCLEAEKRHAVHVTFSGTGDVADLPLDVAVCLFRIAQEALRNGIVHGSAGRLAVSLARTGAHVELSVTDDGRGFDLEAVRRDGSGLGLVSIEERAHAVGGSAQIVTGLDRGTTILVRVPTRVTAHADSGEVPMPPIATRLDRALHSLKGELHRARRFVDASSRQFSGSTDDEAKPIALGNAAGRQSKG